MHHQLVADILEETLGDEVTQFINGFLNIFKDSDTFHDQYQALKSRLEQRYPPVCDICAPRIAMRLEKIQQKIKPSLLLFGKKSSKTLNSSPSQSSMGVIVLIRFMKLIIMMAWFIIFINATITSLYLIDLAQLKCHFCTEFLSSFGISHITITNEIMNWVIGIASCHFILEFCTFYKSKTHSILNATSNISKVNMII